MVWGKIGWINMQCYVFQEGMKKQMFLFRPNGCEVLGGSSPMLRALRALALGYDCRALRALAASAAFEKQPSWGT